MFKRIISLILVLSMFSSMGIPVFAAENDGTTQNTEIIDVELVPFNNVGKVITLVNNYNQEYFVVSEELDANGNHITPRVEKEITAEEFKRYHSGKIYNKLVVNAVAQDNDTNSWVFLKSVFDSKDALIDESISGKVIDGNFNSVYVDGSEGNHSWLYKEHDKYFFVNTIVKSTDSETGEVYQDSVFTEITELQYKQHLDAKDFMYSKVVYEDKTSAVSVFKEIVYDVDNKPIGTPVIIERTNDNIAELAYVINSASAGRYNGLTTIQQTVEKYNKNHAVEEKAEEKHEHTVDGTEVVAPTTESQGYTINTCRCGYSWYSDYVEKLPEVNTHTHDYVKFIISPTYDTEGYTLYECHCGDTYKDEFTDKLPRPHEHSYVENIVNPTYDAQGYTEYTCSCGHSYRDNYKDKLIREPEFTVWYTNKDTGAESSIGPIAHYDEATYLADTHHGYVKNQNGEIVYYGEAEVVVEPTIYYLGKSASSVNKKTSYSDVATAIKDASKNGMNVYDNNGNLIYEYVAPVVEEKPVVFYVRGSKNNTSGQLGPYNTFNEAKTIADSKKTNVYDSKNNLVYKYEEPKEDKKQEQTKTPQQETKPNTDITPDLKTNQASSNGGEYEYGVLTPDLIAKYGGFYNNWSDKYNGGYLGTWLDPYFSGSIEIIDWNDPFWKQEEIKHSEATESSGKGYYDDVGNYIPVDANGNPIPSEPGTFDSAGNFMPQNSSGYYDPNGVYHPLPQVISGIRYEFDGSFHIDNYGYFDINGIWHPEENDKYQIILFDGRIVYKNGYMEYPTTGVKVKIEKDIWGNYFYEDEVIYSDFSVFNIKTNQLTLGNGTVYDGKVTGNMITFGNNDAVVKGTFEKGKKVINGVLLTNGAIITESGIIQYPNGITYTDGIGVNLPNNEILNETFVDKEYIDLGENGRIYPNGHIAYYDKLDSLVTDSDGIIYEDRILLDNGDVYIDGTVMNTYRDKNGNLVMPDGYVISSNLELGAYSSNGGFLPGNKPLADGYYDRNGFFISARGIVKNKDGEIGYYNNNGKFVEGALTTEGYYYTAEGNRIFSDNTVEQPEKLYGYYDKSGKFVMNDGGGLFDKNGTFSQKSSEDFFTINDNGLFYNDSSSRFTLNIDGTISVIGHKGTYNENGMVTLNGDTGYYDEKGMFIISKENPYITSGYFYDSVQNKHSVGTIYKDAHGALRLLQNPMFGLQISNGNVKINSSDLVYSLTGLTTVNGKTGYYNASAKFIESVVSPYKGGFYTETGFWVDRSYYTNSFGEIVVNYGGFNRLGNWVTPSGDIGSFNKYGNFMINKSNIVEDGFYDNHGILRTIDGFYIDEFGMFKNANGSEAYGYNGDKLTIRDSVGLKINDYLMIEYGMFISKNGEIGHFDASGEFVLGRNKYANGFYTPSGGFVKYGTDQTSTKASNFSYILNKYYVVYNNSENGENTAVLTMGDGYAFDVRVIQGKYFELSDGTVISDTGLIGYMENNKFVEGKKEIVPKIIRTEFDNYIDITDEYGYFDKDGTFILYDGGYGYYTEDGTMIGDALNPYSNGFYNYNGEWTQTNPFSNIANIGYFNKYGIKRNGENPYNLGYYDYEGSFHPYEKTYFITYSGNVIEAGDEAIGYIDHNDNLFLYDKNGYFNANGDYYIDTTLQGYYDSDGVLNNGKNPNFDGFYDMFGNWHLFGDKGYYDTNGYYHEDVSDARVGYFNEVGEFTEGFNPYVNGYNDINGNWSDEFTMPLTVYFEKDGTARVGSVPYSDGYYDMYGNWHRYRDKGYFDKYGTYYSSSNPDGGYYDAKGNYFEGTNPYQHGYYDEDGNLRLFNHEGYFTRNGTFVDEKGSWYFLKDGLKKKGENPRDEGFYDKYGNYYPFEEDGYYTSDGLYFPTLLIVEKYRVGSSSYILFEGIFTNPEFVPSSSKNTVQFTFNGDSGAPLFVDTGIKVSKNAMIPYTKARDILHNIAVYSKSTFIEDNDSCIVIVDGKIINLTNNGKMSVNELRNKFLDSNISITVKRSRIGHKFALADSIEACNDIKMLYNGKTYAIRNPMVVHNGAPYIALKDVTEIISYNVKVEQRDGRKGVHFTIKDNISEYLKSTLPVSFSIEVGKSECLVNVVDNKYTYYILKAPIITKTVEGTGAEEVYIPVYLLGNLTGQKVEYNTLTYVLEFHAEDSKLPFEDD